MAPDTVEAVSLENSVEKSELDLEERELEREVSDMSERGEMDLTGMGN